MRCGCAGCQAFMVHADDMDSCVCPDCGSRCNACLGTNTVWSRERIAALSTDSFAAQILLEKICKEEEAPL